MALTWLMPCWSRSRTPICEGVAPLRAAFVISSITCEHSGCLSRAS